MVKICKNLIKLSEHHSNKLRLVEMIPITERGREFKKILALTMLSTVCSIRDLDVLSLRKYVTTSPVSCHSLIFICSCNVFSYLVTACRNRIEMNEKVTISVEVRNVEMWKCGSMANLLAKKGLRAATIQFYCLIWICLNRSISASRLSGGAHRILLSVSLFFGMPFSLM